MTINIRRAKSLWIEAGAMSGPPAHRHQIEFPNDVAEFFREEDRDSEVIFMRLAGRLEAWPRPLTYRGTDYGQWTEIWRLGLLTRRMGGVAYSGKVLRIKRVKVGANVVHELDVTDPGSRQASEWRTESDRVGTTAVTGGPEGRQFGFF